MCIVCFLQKNALWKCSSISSSFDPILKTTTKTSVDTVQLHYSRVVIHWHFFVCESVRNLIVVPFEAHQQVFMNNIYFIPKGNRCCPDHIIKKRSFEDQLQKIRIHLTTSTTEIKDLKHFLDNL